jgi:hypothetical protein
MTEPGKPTAEQPVVAPSVTTAPAGHRSRLSRIPAHLGRARTSTVVLSLLFLAIGTLYLNIRPDVPGTTTPATSDTGTEQPAPVPSTTPPPASETPPEPTSSVPPTTAAPTTDAEPTETDGTTAPTTPEETDRTTAPTTSAVPTRPTAPPTTGTTG